MKIQAHWYKGGACCALIVLFAIMPAFKGLSQEDRPDGLPANTDVNQESSGKTQDSIVNPGSGNIGKQPQENLRDEYNARCIACHKTCVNRRHCKKFGDTWNATNCQKCHDPDPHKND